MEHFHHLVIKKLNTTKYKLSENVLVLIVKGVLHPRSVFGLFLHFSQKLQHIGNK